MSELTELIAAAEEFDRAEAILAEAAFIRKEAKQRLEKAYKALVEEKP
jgi:hypothetical protein